MKSAHVIQWQSVLKQYMKPLHKGEEKKKAIFRYKANVQKEQATTSSFPDTCSGEMAVRMRRVMATPRGWCHVCLPCL